MVLGDRGRMQCAPTSLRNHGAAERCRGSGCPRASLFSPHEWGIKGVEVMMRRDLWWIQPTLRDGGGGFRSALFALHLGQVRGHDGAWPSEDRFHVRHVLTGHAEGRSPSAFFPIPQEWGFRGLKRAS